MQEQVTEPANETGAGQPETQAEEPQTFDADYVRKLRSEAARYRTEAKANAGAAARLAEIEEAQKTEAQKLADAKAEADKRAAAAELSALRYRVAAEKGLPAKLVDRLQGANEEEIGADADALLALVTSPAKPKPDPSQGPRGSNAKPSTAEQFAAAVQGL